MPTPCTPARIPAPRKALAPALHAAMPPPAALRAAVAECLGQLQANAPGVLRGDAAEYVHQARVALRRLRSARQAFAALMPAAEWRDFGADIRWLAARLGAVRNLDVFLQETLPAVAAGVGDAAGFDPLRAAAAARRADALQRARAALKSHRYAQFRRRCAQWLERPPAAAPAGADLGEFSARALRKRRRQVVRLARQWHALDGDRRHTLRKCAKKLRYAAEFFSDLYDRDRLEVFIARLARLQDVLGALNDAAVTHRLMDDLGREHPALQRPAGIVAGWIARDAAAREQQLGAAIKAFRQARKFW